MTPRTPTCPSSTKRKAPPMKRSRLRVSRLISFVPNKRKLTTSIGRKKSFSERNKRRLSRLSGRLRKKRERRARKPASNGILENAPEPFEDEVSACDALVTYLAQWDVSKNNEQSTAVTKPTEEVTKGVEGMKLVKRDDEDDMFSISGGYNKKKNKRGGKNAASSATIQHSFDTLAYFAKIQVSVVAKATDVPSALESIRAKKEEFLQKRKIKKERQAARPS